ncbi:GGDEF domain-containing protein [Pseudoalteromonas tunicata]|uniref:diguanylate cyclase n=1 Tax=Pseudoalteromonas tunicata D2 TaxID=87626 RepID=A4C6Y0_9GAMM|nr:GGDEF domain-containing protein [Pseudoalteromonas tunicata]ATC95704.1 hypothetical protein PTUN_a3360 [Pseudoalteromonas tunicata]AXT31261.1 GGDEF domain-containing protein [Pseudoalteromonas tunicata]EAR29734.1 GGDEF family protein [Pseudoalteromonas tunicata D2]MDP4985065.1 GGDEF domain-containing protein [Pseudoalteromonas tunicata]MDP5213972.1 GGDEF domain-containing protein [Pseudoalteromonas tunicata]
MQEDLLNSVVKITKNRDIDSLEFSLISTIHEFLNCKDIIIYKNLSQSNGIGVEKSASLYLDSENNYIWGEREILQDISKELASCLHSACTINIQKKNDLEQRWLPILLNDKPVGAIYIRCKTLHSEQQVLLNSYCRIYENYLTILNENERDKLTSLLNRQTFDRKIKLLMENQINDHFKVRTEKTNRKHHDDSTSWLAMVDIDHFKKINDTYGHICGDEVLLLLAQRMSAFFRASDLVFRFGGEEFVIVFEPTTQELINKRLAAFMEQIRSTHFPFIKQLTLSIGIARMSPYDFPISVIENADKALYFAKNSGRDQVIFYSDVPKANIQESQSGDEIELF